MIKSIKVNGKSLSVFYLVYLDGLYSINGITADESTVVSINGVDYVLEQVYKRLIACKDPNVLSWVEHIDKFRSMYSIAVLIPNALDIAFSQILIVRYVYNLKETEYLTSFATAANEFMIISPSVTNELWRIYRPLNYFLKIDIKDKYIVSCGNGVNPKYTIYKICDMHKFEALLSKEHFLCS